MERMSKSPASPVFSCLGDILAHYGRTAFDRDAILAPGRAPVTYGMLLACAKDTVRALRSAGIGRSDRVAVALPDGPEAAAAIISVAAGAVCTPLNPGFTADELQRYLVELKVSALLTGSGVGFASRAAARALGIPVLDLSARAKAPGLFSIAGPTTSAHKGLCGRRWLCIRRRRRVYPVDLGDHVAAEDDPAHPCQRLPVGP